MLNRSHLLACIALLAACGSSPGDETPDDDATQLTGPTAAACSVEALSEPHSTVTYYVAAEDPGADDVDCDGLAPTAESATHCPFASFDAVQNRHLLDTAHGVTVALRTGTYIVKGWEGLTMSGTGSSFSDSIILTRYKDEQAVLTVGAPDGVGCTDEATAIASPQCVRQMIRLTGTYTIVQGLTLQDALAFQIEVNGGAHHTVRCNTFRETVPFSMRSDQTKLDGHATDVHFEHNEFSGWHSQAIDITEVDHVFVEHNDFHHPSPQGCGAHGGKKGAHDIFVRHNTIHDLATPECAQVQATASGGGGTGETPHADDFAAAEMHIVENRFWNITAKLAQFDSCKDCSFEGNDVTNVAGGIILVSEATGRSECTTSVSGCVPTTNLRISGNRMKELTANGDASQANTFVFVGTGQGAGFTASDNLYCAPTVSAARFGWNDVLMPFADWTQASATDASSCVLASADAACTGW